MIPSPTLAACGVMRRSIVRPEATAPLKSAGRPSVGSGRTMRVSARLVSAYRSSWLKNCSATGVLYLSVARGIVTMPGNQREHHLMGDEEIVPAPADVAGGRDARGRGLRIASRRASMTGGCRVGGRRSWRRRSRGNQAAVTTSTCSPTLADSAETIRFTAAPPTSGGRARSSSRRRRGLRVEASGRAVGRHVHHQGFGLDRVPALHRASRPELPAAGAHRPKPDLEQRRASRRRAERDLGALGAGDDLQPVERAPRSPASAPRNGSPRAASR